MEEYTAQDSKAPFNMAIATLMSLRQTLDHIRNIEARIDFPAEERQRIKIELVKRFYVDSCPLLMDKKVVGKHESVLDIEPVVFVCVDNKTHKQRKRIRYCFQLNKKLDIVLRDIQIELQNKGYYMPPKDDMGRIGAKMS
jgi:hypothetical protein